MDDIRYGSDQGSLDRSSSKNLQDDFKKVKDDLSQTAQHAKAKASEMLSDAQHRTAEIQENIVSYVKENPVKAIGLALFAGFLTAALVRK